MSFQDCEPELFFATARVILHQPIGSFEPPEEGERYVPIRGYYVRVGLKAGSRDEARKMLEGSLDDGRIDWAETTWYDVGTIDPSLALRAVGAPPGIWYKSGRICFP